MALLPPGTPAPDFEARRPDGSTVRLSELRGRFALVYFYPKDNTPGCTVEACSLNRSIDDLEACGAEVIGVSFDSIDSHRQFQQRYDLRFPLAADRDHAIARAYGVPRMLGILPVAKRVSFLVDPEGRIAEVWPSVNPQRHAADVLAAVRRLGGAATLRGEAARAAETTAPHRP